MPSSARRPATRIGTAGNALPDRPHLADAEFRCDLSVSTTALPHFWEHTIGGDHAPMMLRADVQAQLARCHRKLGFRHLRFHGLLSDNMGTLICHREKFLYSFFNADKIWDFLLSIGMKPFIELSFMPTTLASGPDTVFRYQGNVTPPRDYGQWSAFIRKIAAHWVERYGIDEVRSWYFEVWNEPNLHHFWTGSQEDYFKLYRYTVEALKGVDDLHQLRKQRLARVHASPRVDQTRKHRKPAARNSNRGHP